MRLTYSRPKDNDRGLAHCIEVAWRAKQVAKRPLLSATELAALQLVAQSSQLLVPMRQEKEPCNK